MSRRFIVVDLGIMWDRSKYANIIRPVDRIVLPRGIISDILKSAEWQTHASHFERFLREHQRRVLVSHMVGPLAESEFKSGRPTHELGWIDSVATKAIRNQSLDSPLPWEAWKKSGVTQTDELARGDFLKFCYRMPELLNAHDPVLAKKLLAKIDPAKDVIRDRIWGPLLVQATQGMERFRSNEWLKRFRTFPDRYAFGRYSRLWVWYGLKHAAGQTKDERKNFDDADYAFAASYAGHLLTNDGGPKKRGLKECVNAVFGRGVELL
jgi:hypothetical protein